MNISFNVNVNPSMSIGCTVYTILYALMAYISFQFTPQARQAGRVGTCSGVFGGVFFRLW